MSKINKTIESVNIVIDKIEKILEFSDPISIEVNPYIRNYYTVELNSIYGVQINELEKNGFRLVGVTTRNQHIKVVLKYNKDRE